MFNYTCILNFYPLLLNFYIQEKKSYILICNKKFYFADKSIIFINNFIWLQIKEGSKFHFLKVLKHLQRRINEWRKNKPLYVIAKIYSFTTEHY